MRAKCDAVLKLRGQLSLWFFKKGNWKKNQNSILSLQSNICFSERRNVVKKYFLCIRKDFIKQMLCSKTFQSLKYCGRLSWMFSSKSSQKNSYIIIYIHAVELHMQEQETYLLQNNRFCLSVSLYISWSLVLTSQSCTTREARLPANSIFN